MTKIVVIMMVYQSADVVLDALKSFDGYPDEIICFDGRWKGYIGPDHSDDGTKEIVEEFAKTSKSKISYFQLPILHQWQARTQALKHLENGDWAIVIDSDEKLLEWTLEVNDFLRASNAKAYRICFSAFKVWGAFSTPRIFRKTETTHYSTDHRRIFDKDGEVNFQYIPIIHIVTDHQTNAKLKKMRNASEMYKRWLHKYETTHWNPEDGPDPNQIEL